ncbi:unnamed protein product [Allacma fusca]|uniref:Uncharacterized protein n=1 Tax=Allacma fusca TaxID=39272 RepID=A0A8J2JU96_9HEXA|nr:unnamed protein product [Allacma fusca]
MHDERINRETKRCEHKGMERYSPNVMKSGILRRSGFNDGTTGPTLRTVTVIVYNAIFPVSTLTPSTMST